MRAADRVHQPARAEARIGVGAGSALVVIPTFNEALNIREVLGRIKASAPGVEVLFVDDRGSDGAAASIRAL